VLYTTLIESMFTKVIKILIEMLGKFLINNLIIKTIIIDGLLEMVVHWTHNLFFSFYFSHIVDGFKTFSIIPKRAKKFEIP
jgi:hypothetical protein